MLTLLLLACSGEAPESAPNALVATQDEPEGENCADGGVAVRSGVDDDGDGALSEDEVDSTAYLCDGADGVGGVDGTDGADGEDGEDGEDGASALVTTTEEPAGDNCATGGVRVEAGVDDDRDGVLDPEEVDATEYICHGDDGAPGIQTLVAVSDEPAGENCVNGGQRLDTGADADGSGVLDEGEIVSTSYVCTGATGADGAVGVAALVTTADEPAGDNCAVGGEAVSIGTDDDGDGVLADDEVDTTVYVCDGADGADGDGSSLAGTIVAGDYTVANSLDAALLDGVEQITGTLTIFGASMGDVTLPDLERVGGLTVGNGSTFTLDSLSLPSLTTVDGSVNIQSLSVADWSGFDALENVGGTFTLAYPMGVTTLDAFPNLRSVSVLSITTGSTLTELAGFDALISVGSYFQVYCYATLPMAITGFTALESAPTTIIYGSTIDDLSGFASLTDTTGVITIYYAPLTNLDDFVSLTSPAGLTLYSMPNLTDVSALSGVTSMPSGLTLSGLPALSSLSGVENLVAAGSLSIYDVDRLTNLDAFAALDIDEEGRISLNGNALLTDIGGLSGTTGGLVQLYVQSNPLLTNLDGLEGVTYVGYPTSASGSYSLYVENNVLLTDLDGLYGITGLGYGYHVFNYNTQLCNTTIAALKSRIGDSDILGSWSTYSNRGC